MTDIEMKKQFCVNVSRLRQRTSMSISELARRSGVSLEMLEALERGTVPEELMVDDVFALAEVLGCKTYELLK